MVKSCVDELYQGMLLAQAASEKSYEFEADERMEKALDSLSKAAEYFEDIGMVRQASEITHILLSVAAKKEDKKCAKCKKLPCKCKMKDKKCAKCKKTPCKCE